MVPEPIKDLLGPHERRIREAYEESWEEWNGLCDQHPGLRLAISRSARARAIYDFVTFRIKEKFRGVRGVRVTEVHGFLILIINNLLLVRFRKFGEGTSVSMNDTHQARLWESTSGDLPGMPPHALTLYAGYTVDEVASDFEDLLIARREEGKLEWAYSILAEGEGQVAFRSEPPQPQVPELRPKKTAKRKGG